MIEGRESSYGRLKFVLQCVDFLAPFKIGEIDREMAPYGAVSAGREGVCATVAVCHSSYGCLKSLSFAQRAVFTVL